VRFCSLACVVGSSTIGLPAVCRPATKRQHHPRSTQTRRSTVHGLFAASSQQPFAIRADDVCPANHARLVFTELDRLLFVLAVLLVCADNGGKKRSCGNVIPVVFNCACCTVVGKNLFGVGV
jgi:hypothetical protein